MKAIARGIDPNKDQSYFVYQIKQEQLDKILFPIGEFDTKESVREYAESKNLITSSKPDSQGLCFVGQTSLRALLIETLGEKNGFIYTIMSLEEFNKLGFNTENNFSHKRLQKLSENSYKIQIGEHSGAFLYTIGQRQNLGISNGPWVVSRIDVKNNEVIVTHKSKEAQTFISELIINEMNWHRDSNLVDLSKEYYCQVRYRSKAVKCVITKLQSSYSIQFLEPIKSPAVGQSVVIYDNFSDIQNGLNLNENQNPSNQIIIGGGIISSIG
jgi:tRNA-uridine 2-sulfurtransferase